MRDAKGQTSFNKSRIGQLVRQTKYRTCTIQWRMKFTTQYQAQWGIQRPICLRWGPIVRWHLCSTGMGSSVNCFLRRMDKNERSVISVGPVCVRDNFSLGWQRKLNAKKMQSYTVNVSRAFPLLCCLECTAAGLPQISIVPGSQRTCPASTSENSTIRRPAWNTSCNTSALYARRHRKQRLRSAHSEGSNDGQRWHL